MNARSTHKSASRNQLQPIISVVAVALLLLFIGFLGWRFVGPGNKPENGSLQGLTPEWMVQKARESKGDIDQLSPEDRQKLVSRWGEALARANWQGEYRMVQAHDQQTAPPIPHSR